MTMPPDMDCPNSPNCVSSMANRAWQEIAPLQSRAGDSTRTLQDLEQIVSSLPRTRIEARDQHSLHVTFRSLVFRFIDDVVFLIDEAGGVIHIRSSSRSGYWDFGVNRRRVETIRRLLAQGRG